MKIVNLPAHYAKKDNLAFERLKRILKLCEHNTRFGIISSDMYSYDGCSVSATRRYAKKLVIEGFLAESKIGKNTFSYHTINNDYPFDLVVSEEEKERRMLFKITRTHSEMSAKQDNKNPSARQFNIDEKDDKGNYIYREKYNETARMDKKKSPDNYYKSNPMAMF